MVLVTKWLPRYPQLPSFRDVWETRKKTMLIRAQLAASGFLTYLFWAPSRLGMNKCGAVN